MSTIRALLLCAGMCLTISIAFAWTRTPSGHRVRPADNSTTTILIATSLLLILAMEIWRLLREVKETLQRIYVSLIVTFYVFIATTSAWAMWSRTEFPPDTTYLLGGIFAISASALIGIAIGMIARVLVNFKSVVSDTGEARELIVMPVELHPD